MVVPTNRPEQYDRFVAAWEPLFAKHEVHLIPVRDDEETWERMPDWMPRRTDMIRSLGFYEAWLGGSEFTLTLDDDVRPAWKRVDSVETVDIFEEYEKVFDSPSTCSPFFSVGSLTTSSLQMRGFPYSQRDNAGVAIQYGGWNGVLDYDAATQLACRPNAYEEFAPVSIAVPRGVPVTCCIMNCAFRTTHAPIMWQLPLLDGKYNRFGDIWSGLLQKKIVDKLARTMVINGSATVHHSRASNAFANIEREAPGLEINESLWHYLSPFDNAEIGDRIGDLYRVLVGMVAEHPLVPDDYADHLVHAADCWLRWFDW